MAAAPQLRTSFALRADLLSSRERRVRARLLGAGLAACLALLAQLATPSLAAAASPNERGIVDINTQLGFEQESAAGTGLVLNAAGEVLTNNHVIRGATTIRVVEPSSGASYSATVVGYDMSADIAVLQISGGANFQTVQPGNSAAVSVGRP